MMHVCNDESWSLINLFVMVPLAVADIAEAQQPTKVPRIGYVTGTREPSWDAPAANRDAS
jgi:hypothetical protein